MKNYLSLRKSNSHTKIQGQLVQLWLGSSALTSKLSAISNFNKLKAKKTYLASLTALMLVAPMQAYAIDSDGDGIDDRDEMAYYPSLMGGVADSAITDGTVISSTNGSGLTMTLNLSGDPFVEVNTRTGGEFDGDLLFTKTTAQGSSAVSTYTNKFSTPIENLQIKITDIDGTSATETERVKLKAYYQGSEVLPSEIVVGSDVLEDPNDPGFYYGVDTDNTNGFMDRGIIYKYSSPVDEVRNDHGVISGDTTNWYLANFYTGSLAIDSDGMELLII